MIDYYVEQVVMDLLGQTIGSPSIFHSMEDSTGELVLPAIVVSARQDVAGLGRNQVYTYIVTIEYKTIPALLVVADAVSVMLAIDNAMSTGNPSVASAATYFNHFSVHGLLQAEHQINKERRLNIREVNCVVQAKNLL
jgi:hypothetical protein